MKKNLLIRVIFILQQPCHNVATVKKHYERLDLMVDYPWKFAHVKRQQWKRIFFNKNFNSCQVVKFI
jgi:hypothetical protein